MDSLWEAYVTWQEHTVKCTVQVSTHNTAQSFNKSRPVWLNGWVFVYELSGCRFKSSCCHELLFWENNSCFFGITILVLWLWGQKGTKMVPKWGLSGTIKSQTMKLSRFFAWSYCSTKTKNKHGWFFCGIGFALNFMGQNGPKIIFLSYYQKWWHGTFLYVCI